MSRYLPEPEFRHDSSSHIGILLINLGTPDAPTASALRPYLREFLSDPRVVEIPRLLWMPLLHGVILNTRPKNSALKYQKIWTSEGSPLRVHTEKQAKLLQGYYVQANLDNVVVDYAMRYGKPDIMSAFMRLKQKKCSRILVMPLYPQYAASTTASTFDGVAAVAKQIRNLPELRFVRHFHDHTDYIRALANNVRKSWQLNGQGEKLVMSFHGLPRFSLDRGDPYHCECHKTGRLLGQALGLGPEKYIVTFQSRFGRAEWLQPYTEPTLRTLAKTGIKSVDIICPGFVSDCLETLEEIAMECKLAFITSGGKDFNYIDCPNEKHDFIEALLHISRSHIEDWLSDAAEDIRELRNTATRAKALGAAQ